MSDQAAPRELTLASLHESLGARMVEFAGYRMPVQYTGLKDEHLHTREKAGLFDVSHMGQLRITANDGLDSTLHSALEAAFPVDFENWPDFVQRYSVLLNDNGGIEDDLMLTRLPGEVRAVVNAGNRDHDLALMQRLCPQLTFEWVDAALIALQGPDAEKVLAAFDASATEPHFMQAGWLELDGVSCLATRSGYTGEDGYEISIPTGAAEQVVTRLLKHAEVKPVGLGARDSLRLEAGLPLHGNDISPEVTPVQAGLKFAIAPSRRPGGSRAGGYPGAATIGQELSHGADHQLVGLTSFDNIPVRAGAAVVDDTGETVGTVTSGTVSPCLNRPVMLARLQGAALDEQRETRLAAVVRNKRPVVVVTTLPFVAKRYKR